MSELKRPERYIHFESIKPELKDVTEFYTRKVTDYQYRLKQLNEYADALENEISALKETPKVEVLLDDMVKPLVVVPQRFADWIESQTDIKEESYWYIFDKFVKDSRRKKLGIDFFGVGDLSRYPQGWDKVLLSALVDGYTVEKDKMHYLCERNTGYYLTKKGDTLKLVVNPYFDETNEFTQSEIDKLNIGSYVQIEVEP